MMKLFKGRSIQTHRMKKKPIKQGYKFFALCCSQTSYVYDFFPDGRMIKSTIAGDVERLIKTIPRRGDLKYVVSPNVKNAIK